MSVQDTPNMPGQRDFGLRAPGGEGTPITILDGELDRCFSEVDEIKAKLSPVLLDAGPDSEKVPPHPVPCNSLDAIAWRVTGLADQLKDLRNRILI